MDKLTSSSIFSSRLSAVFFLLFLSFFLLQSSVIAAGPNTVEVNAVVKSAQMLDIAGVGKSGPRKKATFPINMEATEQISNSKIKLAGNFELNLASNTDWRLFAKVRGLDLTGELLDRHGWKVGSLEINWKHETAELTEEVSEIARGDNGSFELEITFQLLLIRKNNSGNEKPPVEEMENILVFMVK